MGGGGNLICCPPTLKREEDMSPVPHRNNAIPYKLSKQIKMCNKSALRHAN